MPQTYVDPDVLARIRHLELTARQVVDGLMAGNHRSPRHGFAVEFAQHREYVPGDDIKHLDWKVFGRTERYYLKQYELDTDLTAWLIIDASGSMRFASGNVSKYDYAAVLLASFAHLIVRQSDRVGFASLDTGMRGFLRAGSGGGQVNELVRLLCNGPATDATSLGQSLTELAGRLGRRAIVMIFSDFLDDPAELEGGLRRLRFDRHEILAVQVLDPAEEDFPYSQATMFRGLEIPAELLADPRGLRQSYLSELAAHRRELRQVCHKLDVGMLEVRTDTDPGLVLARYLAGRQ